jgi:hypothetical protein
MWSSSTDLDAAVNGGLVQYFTFGSRQKLQAWPDRSYLGAGLVLFSTLRNAPLIQGAAAHISNG